MPLIDRDSWYKKHGVTTTARLVEVEVPRKPGTNWALQQVTADVLDPGSGQTVRVTTDVMTGNGRAYTAGQELRVRWSAKRQMFAMWNSATVPEEEFRAALNAQPEPSVHAARTIVVSAESDAPVEERLAKLERLRGSGILTEDEYAEARRQIIGSI